MVKDNKNNIDLDNQEFQNAWNMLQHTHRSVFLTGKAGTGKSTFLKYITTHTKKKHIILAPTGIAAVNVGGQTLHSFFKIPFKPLLPDDPDYSPRRIRETMRYPKNKIKLIKKLELIVIDEISMVRCDIIDFIDKILRYFSGNMREPFGGKQLLFVGDIFQLEPVVTRDMREILRRYYSQFFFFNALVFKQLGLIPIELKKIYRQNDSQFIALLDRVRISHATNNDLQLLNSRVKPGYNNFDDEFTITLATRRDTVDAINEQHMDAIKMPEVTFIGEVDGQFPDADLPTAKELILKNGAQVIFIRNDKENRWVNGTIAKIAEVNEDSVEVQLEDGSCYQIEPEIWENIQYSYDEKQHKVIENQLGTFKQLPIKPAWALTVHKSQGLTFNKVVIDFTGGAFTSGQTYVALSRCTSLEGMTLLQPLSQRDIIVNTAITNFSYQFNNEKSINEALERERTNALYTRAVHAFNNNNFNNAIDLFAEAMKSYNIFSNPVTSRFLKLKFSKFNQLNRQINRLEEQIQNQQDTLYRLADEYATLGEQARLTESKLDEITIQSAIANYKKALRIDPTCLKAAIGKANMLIYLGELDQAELDLKTALKIDGKNFDALMALTRLYQARRNTQMTIKTLKRIIRHHRMKPEPHEILAEIYEKIGLDDLAGQHLDLAKELRERLKRKQKKKKP